MSARFLAVDDNPDNLIAITAQLRDCFPDCSIFEADSGPKAISTAREREPDVILLDILMPGMDGFETCRRLKADPVTGKIPVVFLTALRDSRDMKLEALEAGADAVLTKPVENAEITAQLRAMMKVRGASLAAADGQRSLDTLVAARTRELEESNNILLGTIIQLRAENEKLKMQETELKKALAAYEAKD